MEDFLVLLIYNKNNNRSSWKREAGCMMRKSFKRVIATILIVALILTGNMVNVSAEIPKIYEQQEHIISDEDAWDTEELFVGYVEKTFYGNREAALFGISAREKLSVSEKAMYDFLKEKIEQVAAGELTSAVFCVDTVTCEQWENSGIKMRWSAEDLGVSTVWNSEYNGINAEANAAFAKNAWGQFGMSKVIDALLHDCPYELYWFDKSIGVASRYGISLNGEEMLLGNIEISFSVAEAYKLGGSLDGYTADVLKTAAATTAAKNAASVIEKYAGVSDLEKLKGYRDEICTLVSYNSEAASSSYAEGYGDPWQLIYVFDGDTDTNVVCEGYAKAFQYLCDMTSFESDMICCYTVCGVMSGGTGAGNHMWNIVTMDDNKNYIVDVTNSDLGSIGQDGGLFLNGTGGSVESGYVFTVAGEDIAFTYEEGTLELWGTDGILVLADSKYMSLEEDKTPEEDTEEDTKPEEDGGADEVYNVLVWSTVVYTGYADSIPGVIEKIYTELCTESRKVNIEKRVNGTKEAPIHFDEAEKLENAYDLIWIILPAEALNETDIKVLKEYVDAGGRLVLQGEHAGFSSANVNLTALAQALGTSFSIQSQTYADAQVAEINIYTDLLDGKELVGNQSVTFHAFAPIEYLEPAEMIASYDGKAGIVDQAVGKGRITILSDVDFYYRYRNETVDDLFLRLLLNSSENKDIVEEGGNPNEGFGEECALAGSIEIAESKWTEVSDTESEIFFIEPQTAVITAEDIKCGIDKVYAFVTDEPLSVQEVELLPEEKWTELELSDGVGTIELETEDSYVVYAKITDTKGNAEYISTDKIIIDTTEPVITGIDEEKTYCQPVSFEIEDIYLDSVTIDGVKVTADADGKYIVTMTEEEHVIEAIDKAGNKTSVIVKKGHTWEYCASENVITATCNNTGCEYESAGLTLTLYAETPMEYTSYPYDKVSVENAITPITGAVAGEILYYSINAENGEIEEVLSQLPVDVGNYMAAITLEGQTARIEFEIVEAQVPQYTISWDEDGDGQAEYSEILEYGEMPEHKEVEKASDYQYTYQFAGWSPAIETATKDMLYSAVFIPQIKQYAVHFPEEEIGYEVMAEEGSISPVDYGGSYSFQVHERSGYDSTTLVVTANGKMLIPENGVYTISSIGKDGKDVDVKISIKDTTAPTGTIQVNTDMWFVLQKNISFDKFYTTAQVVEIRGVDIGAGMQSISYCIAKKEVTESELETLVWTPYITKFSINPNIQGIIYAKMVDKSGNTNYISTGGLIFEAPDGAEDVWKNQEVEKFEEYVYKQTTDDDLKGSFYKKIRARAVGQKNKKVTLKWNAVENADGYIIYGNRCNSGGRIHKIKKLTTITNPSKTTWTHKKLLKGTYYKYTVTAYKMVDGKQKVLSVSKMVHAITAGGEYKNPTGIKLKQKKIIVSVGKKKKIKATRVLPKKAKMREHANKFRYESSDETVAIIDKKGRVIGKNPGTCYGFVYIQNGIYKTVKITVK